MLTKHSQNSSIIGTKFTVVVWVIQHEEPIKPLHTSPGVSCDLRPVSVGVSGLITAELQLSLMHQLHCPAQIRKVIHPWGGCFVFSDLELGIFIFLFIRAC